MIKAKAVKGTKEKIVLKKAMPMSRLFPTIVTLVALCAGLTSVRYAFDQKWEHSVLLILLAAFLDGMDGRLARYLDVVSDFGAQIDSFADFINFGVAPAIVVYLWVLGNIHIQGVGWGVVLVLAVCMAIRLARFNVASVSEDSKKEQDLFFVGVPDPASGILVMLPIVLYIEFQDIPFLYNPWVIAFYSIIVGFATASRIRTFSIKKMHVSPEYVTLILASVGLLIAALAIKPWMTISALCGIYILSIPVSAFTYYYKK